MGQWDFDGIELPTPYQVMQSTAKRVKIYALQQRERQEGFLVGDQVRKRSGYSFDSLVVSVFTTRDKNVRLVCESDVIPGMLHIFSPAQMEVVDPNEGQEALC